MWLWDYKLPKNFVPKTDNQWCWYLVRKINYGDFKGLKKQILKKYFPKIKSQLDPGKKLMLESFLTNV